MPAKSIPQVTPKLAYRIPQVVRILDSSRTSVYRLAAAGELDIVKIGSRASAITRESLVRYAESRSIPLPESF